MLSEETRQEYKQLEEARQIGEVLKTELAEHDAFAKPILDELARKRAVIMERIADQDSLTHELEKTYNQHYWLEAADSFRQ